MDSTELRHILVRHEQGAGHAAEGTPRHRGKVGVAIATSGPGATNLVTAIADAYMDSVPPRDHRPGVLDLMGTTPSRRPTSSASRCRSPSTRSS
jgi:glyoxylate carboligase